MTACWKEPYASASSARRAAKVRRRARGIELHVYQCRACGKHHLTSKAPATFKAQAA